mgnify:CR=1 FL=1
MPHDDREDLAAQAFGQHPNRAALLDAARGGAVVKALSVRPPWPMPILRGWKPVENRTRNIAGSYRGPLVIHASKRTQPVDDPSRSFVLRLTGHLPLVEHPKVCGAALGIVELVDAHWADSCFHYDADTDEGLHCSRWALPEQWHLVLRNPIWFPTPIPCKGALGLWNFPDELLPEEFR